MLKILLQYCTITILCFAGAWTMATMQGSRRQYPDFQTDNAREILRLAKSAEMRNFIANTTEPCNNFYKFACGNWNKINPAQISEPRTGIFDIFKKAYNRRVVDLMRGPKHTAESDMERKVKYFFESCLNRMEMQRNYKENLLSIMEEFGGMPALKGDKWQADKFDWLRVIAQVLRKYGKQIILGVEVQADLTNNEINRLYIGQQDKMISGKVKSYYRLMQILRQFELNQVLNMTMDLARDTATDMVDFEQKLATGMADPREGLGMEDKTRLRMLDEMTESYKPIINMTLFVTEWLGYDYRLPVYEYVETYMRNLRNVIESTPKSVVANYIMWQLLEDFRMEAEKTDEKQLMKCVDKTKKYFVKKLDHMVYRQLLQHNSGMVLDVQNMWQELKAAFENTFKSNSTNWMTESTRDKALEKLSAMTIEISSYEQEDFQKEFGDLIISTDNYFENVQRILETRGRNYRQRISEPPKLEEGDTVNFTPAYSAEYNRVLISVAFLQPRYLWDDAYPAALRFSTVGYIMAHEMAHAFDDIVRKYDAKGNLNNWWDRKSSEGFATRKECLRQQYSELKYNGENLPKSNAQDENIADNTGIRVSYAAYENWLARQREINSTLLLQQETLPNLDFTPRQLFFLGVAQLWCSDVFSHYREFITATDVHAPEQVRVVAMMANFDEFAMEFKCRRGSQMHPHRKCAIY